MRQITDFGHFPKLIHIVRSCPTLSEVTPPLSEVASPYPKLPLSEVTRDCPKLFPYYPKLPHTIRSYPTLSEVTTRCPKITPHCPKLPPTFQMYICYIFVVLLDYCIIGFLHWQIVIITTDYPAIPTKTHTRAKKSTWVRSSKLLPKSWPPRQSTPQRWRRLEKPFKNLQNWKTFWNRIFGRPLCTLCLQCKESSKVCMVEILIMWFLTQYFNISGFKNGVKNVYYI